jgi:hypothetical protein
VWGEEKDGVGLTIEFLPMPSLRDKAHGGVLCTFISRIADGFARKFTAEELQTCRVRGIVRQGSGKAARTVHHNKNLNRLGHSLPASQSGLRFGSSLWPSASLHMPICDAYGMKSCACYVRTFVIGLVNCVSEGIYLNLAKYWVLANVNPVTAY